MSLSSHTFKPNSSYTQELAKKKKKKKKKIQRPKHSRMGYWGLKERMNADLFSAFSLGQ